MTSHKPVRIVVIHSFSKILVEQRGPQCCFSLSCLILQDLLGPTPRLSQQPWLVAAATKKRHICITLLEYPIGLACVDSHNHTSKVARQHETMAVHFLIETWHEHLPSSAGLKTLNVLWSNPSRNWFTKLLIKIEKGSDMIEPCLGSLFHLTKLAHGSCVRFVKHQLERLERLSIPCTRWTYQRHHLLGLMAVNAREEAVTLEVASLERDRNVFIYYSSKSNGLSNIDTIPALAKLAHAMERQQQKKLNTYTVKFNNPKPPEKHRNNLKRLSLQKKTLKILSIWPNSGPGWCW